MIVGIITHNKTATFTGVTYGGAALTRLRRDNDGTHSATTEVWYLLNPASGTANVVVSASVNTYFGSAAISACATNQTFPFHAQNQSVVSGTTTANPGTIAVSVAGTLVIDVIATGTSPSAANGQTVFANGYSISGNYAAMGYQSPGTGTIASGYTYPSTSTASQETIIALTPDDANPAPAYSRREIGARQIGGR